MNNPTNPPAAVADNNSFSFLIGDINRGRLMREANETFTDLAEQVRITGRPATMSLAVKLVPAKSVDGDRVEIEAAVQSKAPSAIPFTGTYYLTEGGGVVKNDPKQAELPFRAIAGGAVEPIAPVVPAAQPAS